MTFTLADFLGNLWFAGMPVCLIVGFLEGRYRTFSGMLAKKK